MCLNIVMECQCQFIAGNTFTSDSKLYYDVELTFSNASWKFNKAHGAERRRLFSLRVACGARG